MVSLPVVYVVFKDASVSQPHKAVTLWLSPVFQRPLPEMKQNTRFVHGLHTGVVGFGTNNVFFARPQGGVVCPMQLK